MTEQDKKNAFRRIFPPRVEKLIKALDVMGNCSNKSGYIWDQDLVHDVFVTIAQIFGRTAESFGVKFEVLVDGIEVDYLEQKSKRKKWLSERHPAVLCVGMITEPFIQSQARRG